MVLSPFPSGGQTVQQVAGQQFEAQKAQQAAEKAQAEAQAYKALAAKPIVTWSGSGYGSGTYRTIYIDGQYNGTMQIPESHRGRDEEYIQAQFGSGFVTPSQTRPEIIQQRQIEARQAVEARHERALQHEQEQRDLLAGFMGRVATGEIRASEEAIAKAKSAGYDVSQAKPITQVGIEAAKVAEAKVAQEQKAFAQSLAQMTPEKATAIENLLKSSTAEFASQAAAQKGYDIVGKFHPDFKAEDIRAHLKVEAQPVEEKVPSLDLGMPKVSILGKAPTTEVSISPELISRMKFDIEKVDVGAQLQRIKIAEENLKSFEPLIKDKKFTGTNREYIEYRKAFDTYNKENKVLEDLYKAREKESLTTPALKFTQDISKSLQEEADKLIGVTKETTPGIRTGVSGASSIFTGLPAFAGQAAFSGEQIVRHPSEIVKIAEVGAPTFVSQTKEAAVQDPYRFGGSIVGMVLLPEAGKIPKGIKSASEAVGKLEPASGVTSFREVLPSIKDLTPEPSSRVTDLTAGLERIGEIKSGISKEISQPTRGKEALGATKEVVSDVEKSLSTEISRPTRGKQAFWSAKETLEEMKFGVEKEFAQPTRGKIAVKAVGDVISEFDTSIQKGIRTEFRQPTRGTKAISAVSELTKEAIPKAGLSETERGRGLVELGKEIKYQLNRPAGGTLAEKNIVEILKMFPEKTVRKVTPEELSKIQIPLEEVLKVPEKAREVYPYGRFSKLADRLTTEGENLVEIPKARIPTPKSEIIKPIEELPEIPKARITLSEATKPEAKVTIKRDIQAELQKKWTERQLSMEKQAKEGGAQVTKQGQILLTKQKMKPVEEKPVEVIDLTKMEQPRPVQKSITKMLELEKQAPVVIQKVKPKVVYVSAVQRMQQAQKEAQADLIVGLQSFAPTITETKQATVTIPVQVSGVKQRERQALRPITKEKQLSRQVERAIQKETQITKQVTKQIEKQVEVLVGTGMGRESFFLPSQQYREEGRKREGKERVAYVGKKRISPIFEAPSTLYGGNPLGASYEAPRKAQVKRTKAKPTIRPQEFDMGLEFSNNPLGKSKIIKSKKSNKNDFLKNVRI